ncbi:TPA: hypothetical protein ACGZZR_003821 [Citrobacter sedlakii]
MDLPSAIAGQRKAVLNAIHLAWRLDNLTGKTYDAPLVVCISYRDGGKERKETKS